MRDQNLIIYQFKSLYHILNELEAQDLKFRIVIEIETEKMLESNQVKRSK